MFTNTQNIYTQQIQSVHKSVCSLWACCSLLLSAHSACADWNNRLCHRLAGFRKDLPWHTCVPCRPELACVQPAWMHGECLHHTEGSWKFGRTLLQRQSNNSKGLWSLSEVLPSPFSGWCELYWWFSYQHNCCSGIALLLNVWSFDGESASFRHKWDLGDLREAGGER